MKITGSGKGAATDLTEGAPVAETPAAGKSAEGAFADALAKAGASERVAGAEGVGANTAAGGVNGVAEIGAALSAGKVDAQQAIDLLVGKVLDQQVGPWASPALRAQIETALREALANDPILAGETRRLAR